MLDLTNILDSLEREIRSAKKTMLGGSKYIDEAKCLEYIFALRNYLPDEIKEAKLIMQEKDNIINEANKEAEYIVEDARRHAESLISESEIIKRAQMQADHMIREAQNYINAIKNDAAIGIDNMFLDAEQKLIKQLNVIRDSREDLRRSGIDGNNRRQ